MKFQARDGAILLFIYLVGGIIAKRQILLKWWLGSTERAMERRLKKLIDAGYLARPSRVDYRNQPIPEPIYWLGWRGILYIASIFGVEVQPPKGENENQLRSLEKQLRDCGIHWVRLPNWSLVAHDIKVVDVRLAVERALNDFSSLTLEKWIPEGAFRSEPDTVEYKYKDFQGLEKKAQKRVYPDAYLELIDEDRRKKELPHKVRILCELDMSTHDTKRFGREKVAPGIAYIKSSAFKTRFGNNAGRWLVITFGGRTRINNLMKQTRFQGGNNADLFFFACFDEVMNNNILTAPIWRQVDQDGPIPLIDMSTGSTNE